MESDGSWAGSQAVESGNETDGNSATTEIFTDVPETHEAKTVSRKRHGAPLTERQVKKARHDKVLNRYKQLLNVDIQDYGQKMIQNEENDIWSSQIGSSEWSSSEKNRFFGALDRLGKDNIQGIARRIGTKSEPEVRVYIQLLHQGVVNMHLNNPRSSQSNLDEIPAALEISKECTWALNEVADDVGRHEEIRERIRAIKERGDFWLLTRDLSDRIEEKLFDDDQAELRQSLPAVAFLNLPKWLELSEKVFMNSTCEGDNWRSHAEPEELPSIKAAAFEDFYALAISVLKRIISTTIYCATTRNRTTTKDNQVRKDDVESAIEILNLKQNSRSFWTGAAKRNHLRVYTNMRDATTKEPMAYEQVEANLTRQQAKIDEESREDSVDVEFLSDSESERDSEDDDLIIESPRQFRTSRVIDTDPEDDPTAIAVQDLASESLDEGSGPYDPDEPYSRNNSTQALKKLRAGQELERAREEYMETFDVKASIMEEKRLWRMMRYEPPFPLKVENIKLPKRPVPHRKTGSELEDWRDTTKYCAEWERFQTPLVPTKSFEAVVEMEDQVEPDLGAGNEEMDSEAELEDKSQEGSDDQVSEGDSEGLEALLEAGTLSDQEEYSRATSADSPILTRSTVQHQTLNRSRSRNLEPEIARDISMEDVVEESDMRNGSVEL